MAMSKIFSLSYNAGLVNKLWHESIVSHDIDAPPPNIPTSIIRRSMKLGGLQAHTGQYGFCTD